MSKEEHRYWFNEPLDVICSLTNVGVLVSAGIVIGLLFAARLLALVPRYNFGELVPPLLDHCIQEMVADVI